MSSFDLKPPKSCVSRPCHVESLASTYELEGEMGNGDVECGGDRKQVGQECRWEACWQTMEEVQIKV